MTVEFSEAQLGRLFPTFVRTTRTGEIVSLGPSLRRLLVENWASVSFWDLFRIARPPHATDFAELAQSGRPVTLRTLEKNLELNGLVMEDDAGFIFLASHSPSNLTQIEEVDLTLADFSPTDGAISALTLIGMQNALLDEARVAASDLTAARDTAISAMKAKSEFLANMSHEIRTPLAGIVGFASLLAEETDLPDPLKIYADRIEKLSKVLLTVVNDILDYEKIESGQLELDLHPLAPLEFVSETVDLLRLNAARKNVQLSVSMQNALPPLVLADAMRLRQVLLNLLSNAIKFTDRGGISVVAGYGDLGKGSLRVAVHDTGLGVPPDQEARLFQRFSQLPAGRAHRPEGAGLGLAICKGLVEAMGGRIAYSRRENGGSTFWFEVPAPMVEPEIEPQPASALAPAHAARILLVDDVRTNREVLGAMLERDGHTIVQATDGESAICAADEARFDLILMDVQMPGMDGLEATQAIRARSQKNIRTPIIGVSADPTSANAERCKDHGMTDYVTKPIDMARLRRKIRAILQANPG